MKYKNILGLFYTAIGTGMKYPALHLHIGEGNKYHIKLQYKVDKQYIAILCNKQYIGKIPAPITQAKSIILYQLHDELYDTLEEYCMNPIQESIVHGQKTGTCCFCGLELTNRVSMFHGYGPICADRYGLPYDTDSKDSIADKDNDKDNDTTKGAIDILDYL
jgi:hypothetical protein